jgi:hypothetical protein
MQARTLACKSSTLVKEPRLSSLRTSIESQISSLFHPRIMMRGEVKNDFVGGIAQERHPARHEGQDAVSALLAQVLLDAREVGHEAYQGLGLMNVKVVTDLPASGWPWIGGDDGLHMRQKIYFPFASITYTIVTGNRHMMLKPMYAVQDTTSTGTWQLLSGSS